MMVCSWGATHLFETEEWEIGGFVAVRESLPDELRHIDAVLRQNTTDSTDRQRAGILAFVDEMALLKADGSRDRPLFFWKRRAYHKWKVGNSYPGIHDHPRDGAWLEYIHLWVECYAEIFGNKKCCLATLVAAIKHGYACLHPKKKDGGFVVCYQTEGREILNLIGMYTLSGLIKTKRIPM
jgi:hypothetical protein